jgi:hypothetical protein
MKGYCEKIELSEPQLELCRRVPEPLYLVWSLTMVIRSDEGNFRLSVKEFFS